MVLIPALLYLMGDRAWWLPRWLDRLLPNVDVEGEKLQRAHLVRDRELADELEGLAAEHSQA
jgi:RND superfamily putative drug exporter